MFQHDVSYIVDMVHGTRQHADPSNLVNVGFTSATLFELGVFFAVMVAVISFMGLASPVLASIVGVPSDERHKFALSCRELVFYSFSTGMHIWLYALQFDYCWPGHFEKLMETWPVYSVPNEMRFTYFVELSWYIVGIVLLFLDFRRKDFIAMLIHHVATIVMISFSWHVGGVRVGVVVIILHNISDVFLHLAKILNYMDLSVLSHLGLVAFALSFFVLRLVCFPMLIWETIKGVPMFVDGMITGWGLIIWLKILLVPLHAYWFLIIVRLAMRLMSGEDASEAVNSEYDGDAPVRDTKKTQ